MQLFSPRVVEEEFVGFAVEVGDQVHVLNVVGVVPVKDAWLTRVAAWIFAYLGHFFTYGTATIWIRLFKSHCVELQ